MPLPKDIRRALTKVLAEIELFRKPGSVEEIIRTALAVPIGGPALVASLDCNKAPTELARHVISICEPHGHGPQNFLALVLEEILEGHLPLTLSQASAIKAAYVVLKQSRAPPPPIPPNSPRPPSGLPRRPPGSDLHELSLLLQRAKLAKAVRSWLGLEPDCCDCDPEALVTLVAETWSTESLLEWLPLVPDVRNDLQDSGLDRAEASKLVRTLLLALLPLHPDAPSGFGRLGVDVAEARRLGARLQLLIGNAGIEAALAVALPPHRRGLADAPACLLAYYKELAQRGGNRKTVERIERELRVSSRRYWRRIAFHQRRGSSTERVERPFFLTLPHTEDNERFLEELRVALDGGVQLEQPEDATSEGIASEIGVALDELESGPPDRDSGAVDVPQEAS